MVPEYTGKGLTHYRRTFSLKVVGNKLKVESFLGAFTKLRKAAVGFIISVRLSVGTELPLDRFSYYWTDFCYIWDLSIFRKSVEKMQVSLKSNTNNGYFTWRPLCILIISRSVLLRMRKVSDKYCKGNQNTRFMFSNVFLKIVPFMR